MEDLKRIKDLQSDEYRLVSDSQDIKDTLSSIGHVDEFDEIGCLIVKLDESGADYAEVGACESSVPYLQSTVEMIYPKQQTMYQEQLDLTASMGNNMQQVLAEFGNYETGQVYEDLIGSNEKVKMVMRNSVDNAEFLKNFTYGKMMVTQTSHKIDQPFDYQALESVNWDILFDRLDRQGLVARPNKEHNDGNEPMIRESVEDFSQYQHPGLIDDETKKKPNVDPSTIDYDNLDDEDNFDIDNGDEDGDFKGGHNNTKSEGGESPHGEYY